MAANDGNKPQMNVILNGAIAERCLKIKAITGIATAALVRTALLEWFQNHDGEPCVQKISF